MAHPLPRAVLTAKKASTFDLKGRNFDLGSPSLDKKVERPSLLRGLDAVAAGLFGVVEGFVGAGDHVVAGLARVELRDAGREREGEDAPGVAEEARGDCATDLLGERAGAPDPGFGREHEELLAAVAA